MPGLSAPLFAFGDSRALATQDSYTRPLSIDGMLAMTGPSVTVEPGCHPVRGDLAHIKLAGRCFVPHYAVPMPHRIKAATALRGAGNAGAEALADLPAGRVFDVLDMSGGWAWGQYGEDGPVGYVILTDLEAQPA